MCETRIYRLGVDKNKRDEGLGGKLSWFPFTHINALYATHAIEIRIE